MNYFASVITFFYLLSASAKTLLFKNKSDKVYGFLHSTNTFTDDSYAENLLDLHERPRIRRACALISGRAHAVNF